MQINKINNTQNFGRTIKIYANPKQSPSKLNSSLNEVSNVLNSKPSKLYGDKQSEKIRAFFKSILGDYNGKDGILFRKSEDGDIVLLSGNDASYINRIEKRKKYIGDDSSTRLVFKKIRERLEIAENGKKESTLELYSNNITNPLKYNRFTYGEMLAVYGKESDGRYIAAPNNTPRNKNKLFQVEYQEKSIEI